MNKTLYGSILCSLNRLSAARRVANRGLSLEVRFLLSVLLCLFFNPLVVHAEPYYWSVSGALKDVKFSDYSVACDRYAESFVSEHNGTYLVGSPFVSNIGPYVPDLIGTCNFIFYNPQSKENLDARTYIFRYGDSCQLGAIYNPSMGICNNNVSKGPPPANSCAGNLINIAVGNKYQSETDYQIGSASSLNFIRAYNSLDGLWRHNYSAYLRFAGSDIALVMHHGRESFFTVSGTTVTPTSSDLGVLSKTDTGWQFVSTDNERFTFDTAGKLIQWANARGAVHQLTYAGSQVTVTDNLGNSLLFTEDADHQPLTLTSAGAQIAYGYDANKRLTSVTRTAGGQTTQRQFHYEDSRNISWLTGITDERGVRYATWSYDDQGRAISSEHADGADRVSVAYNSDGTVSVTNELGKVAKYSLQYIKGVKRITSIEGEPSANCPNSNSTFTYDSRGLLKTKTDNKGHLTTYDYNERGLEVSRTEAAGTPQARTITTDWHPTLFLPVTVTEPSRITTYTYDDQGRQLSQSVTQR